MLYQLSWNDLILAGQQIILFSKKIPISSGVH